MEIIYCENLTAAIRIIEKRFHSKIYHNIFCWNNKSRPKKKSIIALTFFVDLCLDHVVKVFYKSPDKRVLVRGSNYKIHAKGFLIRASNYRYDYDRRRWYCASDDTIEDENFDIFNEHIRLLVIGEGSATLVANDKAWNIIEKIASN